jgi:hypothetical protein
VNGLNGVSKVRRVNGKSGVNWVSRVCAVSREIRVSWVSGLSDLLQNALISK